MPSNGERTISTLALGGLKWLAGIFTVGGVGLAIAQGITENRVTTLEDTAERNQPVIDSIDVMQFEIKSIRIDVEDLAEKMDAQHAEVMRAIRAAKQ